MFVGSICSELETALRKFHIISTEVLHEVSIFLLYKRKLGFSDAKFLFTETQQSVPRVAFMFACLNL